MTPCGSVQYGSFWGAFPLRYIPSAWYFLSTILGEVASELYHDQNMTCTDCWSQIWTKSIVTTSIVVYAAWNGSHAMCPCHKIRPEACDLNVPDNFTQHSWFNLNWNHVNIASDFSHYLMKEICKGLSMDCNAVKDFKCTAWSQRTTWHKVHLKSFNTCKPLIMPLISWSNAKLETR